jgi:hypothetical protein
MRGSHRLRIQIEKKFSTNVRLRSRFEQCFINFSDMSTPKIGTNFYQNLHIGLSKNLQIKLQFSSFHTIDYDARIYEYENDLPGVFSNYPLYGSGNKWYIMLTTTISKNIKIWLKYRQLNLGHVNAIGSGLSSIEGNSRQDVHFQIIYKY